MRASNKTWGSHFNPKCRLCVFSFKHEDHVTFSNVDLSRSHFNFKTQACEVLRFNSNTSLQTLRSNYNTRFMWNARATSKIYLKLSWNCSLLLIQEQIWKKISLVGNCCWNNWTRMDWYSRLFMVGWSFIQLQWSLSINFQMSAWLICIIYRGS